MNVTATMLVATFLRPGGPSDRITVRRSDGSEVAWRFPTYGANLPHDLIHLIVEAGFGLRSGFWGCVDAGADPAAINESAGLAPGRGRPHHGERFHGFAKARSELRMAEALAATQWFDSAIDDVAMCDSVASNCATFGVESPPRISPERVARVRASLSRIRTHWLSAESSPMLTLRFHAHDPEASITEILCGPLSETWSPRGVVHAI